ncbi:melanocyte-stimulating hormone receptor-like [Crassostrea angulata]|uniref:melanocyte-stimulating hormone receptor-like n=1 Tax=Magallana angulata TaxID=2784310 RepID=UPI0022B209BC|nr:melanocyte-stimulating hormone receptor-like [Crassostrea angulata]
MYLVYWELPDNSMLDNFVLHLVKLCIGITRSTRTNMHVVIAASILFCIGLIGNSITVCFVAVSKQLHTPTYVTIGCLAVSDVLVSVTQYVRILPGPNEYLLKDNSRNLMYAIFSFLCIHSACFHMVLVAYVRFVFITNPLRSLNLTCKRILWMSFAVWISSIVVSIGYGIDKVLFLMGIVSFETVFFIEVGFGSYVSGLPFIILVVFNVRKLYYLYNQTAYVRRTRIANSMSLMFFIITVIFLLHVIYPLFYEIDLAVLKDGSILNRRLDIVNKMYLFALLVNSSLNPLVYFMFSPPVLRLLSRFRKYCNHCTYPCISNPSSGL